MPCSYILPSIIRDCEGSVGGVKEIYIANKSALEAETDSSEAFVVGEGSGTFTVGQRPPQPADKSFRRYVMPRGAAVFGTTAVINRETGANYFTNAVTIALNKMTPDGSFQDLLRSLVLGEFVIIVRDNNDVAHLVGYGLDQGGNSSDGAMATEGSTTTGTAFADRNGETVTLSADESAPAPVCGWDALWAAGFNDFVMD